MQMQTTAPTAGTAAPVTPAPHAPRVLPLHRVPNFTEADLLAVGAYLAHGNCPATVSLMQHEGSMHFQHSMTPAQARLLAVYLVDCANAIDNPADRVIADGEGGE